MIRNSSGGLVELANGTVTHLMPTTGAPNTATNPMLYHRRDGFNAILFESTAGHVIELFKKGSSAWSGGDLSALAGEDP